MLADTPTSTPGVGALRPGVHRPGAFLRGIIDFIAAHLPSWRDDPERPAAASERELTAQLAASLNAAARAHLDIIHFQTERPDPARPSRTIDLAAQPSAQPIYVAGRRFTKFDLLLPIECKRLPTPSGGRRDPREYVTTGARPGGGIQRFKLGLHGSAHTHAILIAYIQSDDPARWLPQINAWIAEAAAADPAWTGEELAPEPAAAPVFRARSSHSRPAPAAAIEISHLWIRLKS
ncbi:MAG: hypothetical protein IPK80_04250 [Nannocystis sp.]|nr:hypothetical protein [Nannocystis sp.]